MYNLEGSPVTGGAAAPSSAYTGSPLNVNAGSSLWWQSQPNNVFTTQNLLIGAVALVAVVAIYKKWK